jgi:hypothetical protein
LAVTLARTLPLVSGFQLHALAPYRFWPQLCDDLAGDDDLEHALEDAVHKIGGAGMTLLGEPLADRELCRLPLRGPRRP